MYITFLGKPTLLHTRKPAPAGWALPTAQHMRTGRDLPALLTAPATSETLRGDKEVHWAAMNSRWILDTSWWHLIFYNLEYCNIMPYIYIYDIKHRGHLGMIPLTNHSSDFTVKVIMVILFIQIYPWQCSMALQVLADLCPRCVPAPQKRSWSQCLFCRYDRPGFSVITWLGNHQINWHFNGEMDRSKCRTFQQAMIDSRS